MQFLKGLLQKEKIDLTPFILQARRGLRRDVKALADALPRGLFFIPLAKKPDDVRSTGEEQAVISTGSPIYAHTLSRPDTGAIADVFFTRKEFMTRFQDEFGWRTDGGPLEYNAMSAKILLELALQHLESGDSACLLVNPFHDSMLELQLNEVKALVKNEPIPLKRYVQELPVQEDERFIVGAPAIRPPKELVDIIHRYVLSHSDLTGYDLFQIFNADRDTETHLALNLFSKSGVPEPEAAREVHMAIYEKIPAPGYVDIFFNSKLSAGMPNIETYRKP